MKDSVTVPVYNYSMVTDLIRATLDALPRGSKSRLANEVGVSAATITKWYRGDVCPEPNRWPAIEAALGLEPGALRDAGLAADAAKLAREIDQLRSDLRNEVVELDALTNDADLPDGVRQGIRRRLHAIEAIVDRLP